MARFIYLHGFASSPKSTKAVIFRERLARLGHDCVVLDLEEGDFTGLTITRQLAVLRREVDREPGPLMLVGSSMGGYLAALFASREPRVTRLVLMAPAIDMLHRWKERFGEAKLAEWKLKGVAPTFHHGYGEERMIGYGLYADLADHDANPKLSIPTLAFMGRKDDTVDPASVAQWASENPSVRLRWLDSGHDLVEPIETIWSESEAFLRESGAGL